MALSLARQGLWVPRVWLRAGAARQSCRTARSKGSRGAGAARSASVGRDSVEMDGEAGKEIATSETEWHPGELETALGGLDKAQRSALISAARLRENEESEFDFLDNDLDNDPTLDSVDDHFGDWAFVRDEQHSTLHHDVNQALDDPQVVGAFDESGPGKKSSSREEALGVQDLVKFRLGQLPKAKRGSHEASEGINMRGKVRARRIAGSFERILIEALQRGDLGCELQAAGIEFDEVNCSLGVRYVEVWWRTETGNSDEIQEILVSKSQEARKLVVGKMKLRRHPEIRWKPSTLREDAAKLDSLFDEVEAELADARARGIIQ